MRLLHTSAIELFDFYDYEIPKYAILSHTWGKEEVSLHDLQKMEASERDGLEGYMKIKACCKLAALEGYQYVWIDTCCIDKTSSAELSEAINSMYRWYHEAQVCYVYLADVCIGDKGLWSRSTKEEFRDSKWFTRGWTLQELLAPENVAFYDKNWQTLGSKRTRTRQISVATGIQYHHLNDMEGASVAQKMSWASGRKTTRVEDIAYSLMGLFDVNMPLLYGEGKKAFIRLQQEIVKISDDESIFAWRDRDLVNSGIFAQWPKAFAGSGNVIKIFGDEEHYVRRSPYTVTNRGLAIEIFSYKDRSKSIMEDWGTSFVPLNCLWQPNSGTISVPQPIAIELDHFLGDVFVRSSPGHFFQRIWSSNVNYDKLVYVQSVYTVYNSHEQQHLLFITESSLRKRGLIISETYGCQLKPHFWEEPEDGRCWRISLERHHSLVALLLKSHQYNCPQMFAVILRGTDRSPCIALTVVATAHTFQLEMDKYSQINPPLGSERTRCSMRLQDNSWINVALKKKRVAPGERQHYVEFLEDTQNVQGVIEDQPSLEMSG